MGLQDLGKTLGQLFTAFGAQALGQLQDNQRKAIAAELGSMELRKRKRMADKLRKELAEPELALPAAKRLAGLVTDAAIEGKPKPFLDALEQAFVEAQWNSIQRFSFLQKVVPDVPMAVQGVTVKGLSFGAAAPQTDAAADAAPAEAAPAEPPEKPPEP
jgi:hypothetical protein